jgi:hypothetical protein
MSLYRHVSGKDELIQLMADATFAEQELPARPPPGWRAQLEALARVEWAIYRRHPWLAQVISLSFSRPAMMPNGMAHTEWALRAVDGLGLDPATLVHVALMVLGHVQGTALKLMSEVEAEQDTGITSEQWMESQSPALTTLMASGGFPTLLRVASQGGFTFNLDTLFEFGLQRMLDGLETFIGSVAVTSAT